MRKLLFIVIAGGNRNGYRHQKLSTPAKDPVGNATTGGLAATPTRIKRLVERKGAYPR